MKLTRFLPALAAMTLGIASAQTLMPYNNAKLPFSFSYPKGWLGVDLGDKTNGVSMVSAKTPPASMIRLLYASIAGNTTDLNAQADAFQSSLASANGVTVKKQSNYMVNYGGLRGLEREYVLSNGKKSIKMRVWLAADKKNLYSFQVTDSLDRYPAASNLFTSMMRTVKFK